LDRGKQVLLYLFSSNEFEGINKGRRNKTIRQGQDDRKNLKKLRVQKSMK